jgi:hypothetical protein
MTALKELLYAAAALLWASAAVSQNQSVTGFDFRAAERQLKETQPGAHTSLHELQWAPDGTKGIGLGKPSIVRVALPNPLPPPFKSELDWQTYYQYCGWDGIVRAIHIDSTPVLTSDKSLVYTVSHFAIIDTIKSDVPFTSGQLLVAYQVGGTVEDGGEHLIVATPDSAAFEPGKSYILLLRRDKNTSVQQYFIPMVQTIAVTSDKVYPISGRFAWLSGLEAFPSGSTYADIRNTFARVHALKSCPELP